MMSTLLKLEETPEELEVLRVQEEILGGIRVEIASTRKELGTKFVPYGT